MTAGPHSPDPQHGDDEWGAAPTHPESVEAAASAGTGAGPDDDWGPAAPLDHEPAPPARDTAWTAEDPFARGHPKDADADWDPAPPLPLPTARPKTAREPKRATPRGSKRGRRGSAGRRDGLGGPDAEPPDDRPSREPKADRPLPSAEERLQIALKHAYRYLTKRDRTEAEVRAYLEKRETDPSSLEAAIVELLELQYLDDERYVQRYVEDRRRLDGWGPVRISQGLRKIGIDASLIGPAIEAVTEESAEDDVDLATELVQRRFNRRPLDGDKDRQKALRAVVSKGHNLDVAYAAVRAYEARCAEEADD